MKNKSIDEVASRISKKLGLLRRNKNTSILKKYLKPCLVGIKSDSDSISKSKIGGTPLLPDDFVIPSYEGQSLKFLSQIDFSETHDLDISNTLPSNGMLIIFMYLENETGDLTIPNFNPAQLRSYYFENTEILSPCKDESVVSKYLNETKISFNQYMDFPESGDYQLTEDDAKINKDFILSWELIPQEFQVESPSFKLLGYPTDDAMNTYPEWFFFENEINLMTPEDSSRFYKQAEDTEAEFSLLMQINLEGLGAINLDDEFAEFGGISIGIKTEDLKNRNFERLQFKYTMS